MSTLAMLPDVKEGDVAVLELDSWQLQGFRDLKISPHIAVFTNFMPDHMNYYKNDMELYFHDKAAIFENQKPDDFLIAGPDIALKMKTKGNLAVPAPLPAEWKLLTPGEHNRLNAGFAREALRLMGVDDAAIRGSFESFAGLEGRLNFLAEINGVKIYNDSNATTPAATIAALKSFEEKKILLIAGGADKGLEAGELAAAIKAYARETAFLAGTGTQSLSGLLPGIPVFDNLEKAFYHVMDLAEPGDALLLSPGFASFGMFRNEYDRGAQFESIVSACRDKISRIANV
jgi:UDP-N-acetylmuramoylalanine--D-glutamate ligase